MRGFTRLNRVDLYQYEAQQAKKLSSTLTTGELPRDIPIDDWETWAEYVKPVIFPQDPRKVRWDVGMLVFQSLTSRTFGRWRPCSPPAISVVQLVTSRYRVSLL